MVDETLARVMDFTNNYFAVLYERVYDVVVDGATVTGDFRGAYTAGMLVRIHFAYDTDYNYREGDIYEVADFDGNVLTLDRPLHTQNMTNAFIAVLDPTDGFRALCADIADYTAKAASRAGLNSESIDGYSWSAAPSGTGYASVFADRLKAYRLPAPTKLYYTRWARQWQ